MAIRIIRKDEDEVLRKKCKEIDKIDDKLRVLLDDMAETMYDANGVGLAAPQVGIIKRAVVIDAGSGLLELINPKVISESGEQSYIEGCLSYPGIYGETKRPAKVVVEALDRNGKKQVIEGEQLLAVALCHEIDHLDGIIFKDKVIKYVEREEAEEDEE
ncbi:MAG: peptide deformylase [Bacillota bacterium]|nr:peptide deformylase [Bacillota bacterium]